MAYNVTLSDGVTVITIPDGGIYETYSIPIVGQNTAAFGDDIATAFLRQLENFSAALPPDTNPNIPGGAKLEGQLWYDSANQELKVHNGVGDNWIPLLVESGLGSIGVNVAPDTDSSRALGANSTRWSHTYTDSLTMGGTLTAEGGSVITTSGTLTADGGSTVNLNGTNTIAGATFTNKIVLDAASGSQASLNIPTGTSTSTTNGDIWYEADGLHIIIAGVEEVVAISGATGGVTSFGPSGSPRSGAVTTAVADYSAFYAVKDGSSGTQTISGGAAWTFNNIPAFNGGATGATAPFTVDSTFLVTNLNADLLDGQQGSYYAVDSAVVKLTGSQNIDGDKTFTNKVRINSDDSQALRLIGSSTGNANQVYVSFYESNDTTEVARIGDDSASDIFAYDYMGGGSVIHEYGGANRISLLAGTSGSSAVTLWAPGNLTALQIIDASAASSRSSNVLISNIAGAVYSAGFNETPQGTVSGSYTLSNSDIGKFLTRTATTTTTVTLPAASNMAIGASSMIHNDNATNTLTIISDGTSVIEWIDGSGSTPITGTRTIAYNGLATVRRKSTNNWQIWGVGIS